MSEKTSGDTDRLRSSLYGANLKKLLREKKVTKYAIARDCSISYRTILFWQSGKVRPSEESALRVGVYLGLIKPKEVDLLKLKKEYDAMGERLNRMME